MGYVAREINDAVIEFESSKEWAGQDWYGSVYEKLHSKEDVFIPKFGQLSYVDSYGGEGSGDDYWVVFKVGDQYFRVDGWYSSYDGGELDGDLYEVKPVQVQKTEYREIEEEN